MNQATVQVVGHMVRFLPRAEKEGAGGKCIVTYAARMGAFVLVVGTDPSHFQPLSSRLPDELKIDYDRKNKDEDPGPEVHQIIMKALLEKYPFCSQITVGYGEDRTGRPKYFLLERDDRERGPKKK